MDASSRLSCSPTVLFEAVRIRSVAQPDYATNTVGVVRRMVKEEGAISLINAVPVFLAKNVPYAMTKFTVFDISTEWMYDAFPAAHGELKMSLVIMLIGGVLGGISAACISNPADVVISELKKGKSDMSPQQAVDVILQP
jgi:solute carrier family 25 phosphate transporter 3